MLRKCCGYSPPEWAGFRMWCSCGSLWLFLFFLVRIKIHVDWFRLVLIFSPGFVTMMWAPLQKEPTGWKVVAFGSLMTIFYWTVITGVPVQCRHAWGARMVTDRAFYTYDASDPNAGPMRDGDSLSLREALRVEQDNFFYTGDVSGGWKGWLLEPPNQEKTKAMLQNAAAISADVGDSDDFEAFLAKLGVQNAADEDRAARWLRPLTGGHSLDILLLRSYCSLHAIENFVVHVYPLKVIGISPGSLNVTVPCPYWSCVMTEARPGGKLFFILSIVICIMLQFFHARCDCLPNHMWSYYFGGGRGRSWWVWFWAAVMPLWSVLFIKTTYDMELIPFGQMVINNIWAWYEGYVEDPYSGTQHKVIVAVLGVALLFAVVYYREKVKKFLGFDQVWFADTTFVAPTWHPDDHNTFQVCIWRLDLHNSHSINQMEGARSPAADRGARSLEVAAERGSPRIGGSAACGIGGLFGGYMPMLAKDRKGNSITTTDGSKPSLQIRFSYGGEEIQRTRIVKPTAGEWSSSHPVYFQENFRMNIDWEPNCKLRVDVRDARYDRSLASMTLDESALLREFETSAKIGKKMEWHSVPVTQVVRMLEQPTARPGEELNQMEDMMQIGFALHELTGGGALWLSFAELPRESGGLSILCCE